MDRGDWIEAFRTTASIASPDSMQGAVAQNIADLLRSNGIEAHVGAARPRDSVPLWDNSGGVGDTVSVFVPSADAERVLEVYEALTSGDMEIDDDFDPGEPIPGV